MIKDASTNKQQAQIIKDFRDTTQASAKQALQFLTRAKWNIQNAINMFFDEGTLPEQEVLSSTKKIEDLFEELSTPSPKHQGIRFMDEEKFTLFNERYFKFADNNVVLGYILVVIMDVPTSGYIQFKHFVKLFQYLNVTDPKDLHKYSTKLQVQLRNNKQAYKEMYRKMYKFYLFVNKEHSLDYQIAEELWTMYLKPIMPLYPKFIQYLQSLTKKPMKVHRDLWNMVYEFATTIKDVKDVNESDGWPVFLDEFVEYCNKQ